MPNTNPLLAQKSILAFAIEADIGVAETELDASIKAYDVNLEPVDEPIMTPTQGGLGVDDVLEAAQSTELTCYNYACGKGAAGVPAWSALLLACGMKLTGSTYSIETDSGAFKSMTAAQYLDGWKYSGRGFMGNWTLTAEAGRPWRFDWRFVGGYSETPGAAAIPASTAETVNRVAWGLANGLTIGGQTYDRPASINVDFGAAVELRQDPGSPKGFLGGCITDIVPIITMDPEAMAAATRNWHTVREAGTKMNIVMVLNGGTNNTLTLTATDCMLNAMPAKQNRAGKATNQLSFVATGGLSLAFT